MWNEYNLNWRIHISDKSVVLSSPTGSGKTVIFELAIISLLEKIGKFSNLQDSKIIYGTFLFFNNFNEY